MYEGTLDGLKVCIKRLRVYTRDDPKITTKVHMYTIARPVLHH